MKKCLALLLGLSLCLPAISTTAFADSKGIKVNVEGESVQFDQPPVIFEGRTLVPIRAVCEKIGATIKWDVSTQTTTVIKGNKTLSLQIDSQLMQVSGGAPVQLDVPPQIYNGRTLLPIRAVVENLGYEVTWNAAKQILSIEQEGAIIVDDLKNTQAYGVANWAQISSVHQFSYKGEGLAYAYTDNNQLKITTPGKTLTLGVKYPILGDVISDDDGNFYVVWGKANDTQNAAIETVFISKYSPEGQELKTTGFVGKSTPWRDADSAKTKIPFDSGNSVSVISDGILVNYHSKERYDGHQSDNVIAVKIADMSAYSLPNDTYSGHSFNQSLIYSKKSSGFLFASHGDAYARGFRVNNSSGKYGDDSEILFHFYLEANSNYDMYIVNTTFAQLGGLAETSKGVALVGASAKSISEKAKSEKQNLFVQLFDPQADQVSASMFIGGEVRSGALSTDINDRDNSPLESVTDYGVHWLTNYNDTDVIAPQVVSANDRIVILWSTDEDTFYMVLSEDGTVITPATSLGGQPLNSFERPVYYDGAVYWAAVKNGRLKIMSLRP
ncbi:copper amine oxidase N-terminal domain-containing protein [Paenibacillus camerounensis]|uniref:copper amine oxidase N-terminal domain-containing protein n=1 Tax=Paenibacillus camerounensis TaxID=1243663 RepID=UPI000694B3C5|nr:copper amine oxidase N-terminal domain-containing protein [Paenibacillus camerounensis]